MAYAVPISSKLEDLAPELAHKGHSPMRVMQLFCRAFPATGMVRSWVLRRRTVWVNTGQKALGHFVQADALQ